MIHNIGSSSAAQQATGVKKYEAKTEPALVEGDADRITFSEGGFWSPAHTLETIGDNHSVDVTEQHNIGTKIERDIQNVDVSANTKDAILDIKHTGDDKFEEKITKDGNVQFIVDGTTYTQNANGTVSANGAEAGQVDRHDDGKNTLSVGGKTLNDVILNQGWSLAK